MNGEKSPVEKLAELLLTEFESDELEPELARYKGDLPTRVLEYCLDNDPFEIARKMFNAPLLRRLLDSWNVPIEDTSNHMGLVNSFLRTLGFPVIPKFIGIKQALSKAKFCQQNINMVGDKERIGLVTDLYNELERVIKDIFLFYFRFFFVSGSSKDDFNLILRRKFKVDKPLERLGLGDFISLLRKLDTALADSRNLKKRMLKVFGREHILSKTDYDILNEVSKHRKFFVHYKGKMPSIKECENIVTNISTLLELFETEMIYPNLIRINEIVINRYGIKCVKAVDESDDLWKIYTNVPIEVNKLYFIYSKTGQIAINPIIMEKIDV